MLKELIDAFAAYDADAGQRCLVLTGSEKAFAAGADIKEMQAQGFADMYSSNFFAGWEKVTATRKPWIAAVAGFALGGGCEVAMMADFIIAADTAKFGQPEIKLGVTPGMGGSQRLTHAVGKAKAMEMCLTGRMMGAEEAERSGLVAKVVPAADLLDEALKTAETIASMAPLAAIATKEMVNAAFENEPCAGDQLRAPAVPRPVRHRGPEGRHGRLRRKAPGKWTGSNPLGEALATGWSSGHSASPGTESEDGTRRIHRAGAIWAAAWRPNLAKAGHEVRAFDLSEEALAHAVERGCKRAESAAEAVQGCRRGGHHAARRQACRRGLSRLACSAPRPRPRS